MILSYLDASCSYFMVQESRQSAVGAAAATSAAAAATPAASADTTAAASSSANASGKQFTIIFSV